MVSPTASIATTTVFVSDTSDGDVFSACGQGHIVSGGSDVQYHLRLPPVNPFQAESRDESNIHHALLVRAWERNRTCEMLEEAIRARGRRTRGPGYITAEDFESPSRGTRGMAYGLGDIGDVGSGGDGGGAEQVGLELQMDWERLARLKLEQGGSESVGRMGMVRADVSPTYGSAWLASKHEESGSVGRMGMVRAGNGSFEKLSVRHEESGSVRRMGMVLAGSNGFERWASGQAESGSVGRMGMVFADVSSSVSLERLLSKHEESGSVGRMGMGCAGM